MKVFRNQLKAYALFKRLFEVVFGFEPRETDGEHYRRDIRVIKTKEGQTQVESKQQDELPESEWTIEPCSQAAKALLSAEPLVIYLVMKFAKVTGRPAARFREGYKTGLIALLVALQSCLSASLELRLIEVKGSVYEVGSYKFPFALDKLKEAGRVRLNTSAFGCHDLRTVVRIPDVDMLTPDQLANAIDELFQACKVRRPAEGSWNSIVPTEVRTIAPFDGENCVYLSRGYLYGDIDSVESLATIIPLDMDLKPMMRATYGALEWVEYLESYNPKAESI